MTAAPEHDDAHSSTPEENTAQGVPVIRCLLGGVLMGLANLVPGISGGTMLVACGIYTRFIDAVSNITRMKLGRNDLMTLGLVIIGAVVAIGGLASIIHWSLVHHRWIMYSLFIGLTLGGVPILYAMAKPISSKVWGGVVIGAILMGGLVYLQESGTGSSSMDGPFGLVLGGSAAASAMILPGVSGAFLLLLLGLYETIIGAIKDTLSALKDADIQGVLDQMSVVIPVGIGVVLGVVVVSNLLRWVLHRYERVTLGVLLGLIVAAPAGLYPFRDAGMPQLGDTIKGELVTIENLEEMQSPENAKDWDQQIYAPSAFQVVGSLGIVVIGFGATLGIARLGREK
ncbi:MAG: DUF368 domain-containing protein [Phycisphaerales bacterium]|nr:DUF368 domain-containing protein [Phycisphaerales bacterium]